MLIRTALALVPCLSLTSLCQSEPIDNLRELRPALTRCWRAPAGTVGSELTVALALKRDGHLLGRPRITHAAVAGSAEAQKRFVGSVLASLSQCTPVRITDSLGQAIAGRRFMIRFQSKPRERQAYRDVNHDYVLRDGEARASPRVLGKGRARMRVDDGDPRAPLARRLLADRLPGGEVALRSLGLGSARRARIPSSGAHRWPRRSCRAGGSAG